MSPLSRTLWRVAFTCALPALLAAGCAKKRNLPFDPDAGHPGGFFPGHSTAFRADGAACTGCHGSDMHGGISRVSCFSAALDGRYCHPDGPEGHPDGWRSNHASSDPALVASCAGCHDNPATDLPPNCFTTSLCHGVKTQHPSNWRSSHTGTSQNQAPACAACHQSAPGAPGCFNNTLCHGAKNPHAAGWEGAHDETGPEQAATCAACHRKNSGTPGCFNNTLCHGQED